MGLTGTGMRVEGNVRLQRLQSKRDAIGGPRTEANDRDGYHDYLSWLANVAR